jgi:hypothetical protein
MTGSLDSALNSQLKRAEHQVHCHSMRSGRFFEKVGNRIATWGKAPQLKNSTSIAPVICSVQADMQNDLASPHARRLSAGEDEIDRLLKIVLRQATHIGRVPVVDFSRAVRERLEIGHLFRPRRPKRMRQSLQMVLKYPVHDMDMVEDAKHDEGILGEQLVEIPADRIIKATIGPSLDVDKLAVRQAGHEGRPSVICCFNSASNQVWAFVAGPGKI